MLWKGPGAVGFDDTFIMFLWGRRVDDGDEVRVRIWRKDNKIASYCMEALAEGLRNGELLIDYFSSAV